MKLVLMSILCLFASSAMADSENSEFRFSPRIQLGMGYYSEDTRPSTTQYGYVSSAVFLFNNESDSIPLAFNLLGVGATYSDRDQVNALISPLSLTFYKHVALGFNIRATNPVRYGFSLMYQF